MTPKLSAHDQQLWAQSEARTWTELMDGTRPLPAELADWQRVGPGLLRRGGQLIRLQYGGHSLHGALACERSPGGTEYHRLSLGHLSFEAYRPELDRAGQSGWRRWLGWLPLTRVRTARVPRPPLHRRSRADHRPEDPRRAR